MVKLNALRMENGGEGEKHHVCPPQVVQSTNKTTLETKGHDQAEQKMSDVRIVSPTGCLSYSCKINKRDDVISHFLSSISGSFEGCSSAKALLFFEKVCVKYSLANLCHI